MPPDVGLSEVAELLGCSKSAAAKYALRADFPAPRILARGRVWDSEAVERWARETLPLRPGRPPKTPPK